MHREHLESILKKVQSGELTVEQSLDQLRSFPYDDLGYAKIDSHRGLRTGFPEVIFCSGKTTEQIIGILENQKDGSHDILCTRSNKDTYEKVLNIYPEAKFAEHSKSIIIERNQNKKNYLGPILVCCAGTSDIPVAEEAKVTAKLLGHEVEELYDVGVAGIHRLLDKREVLWRASVIIVIAGMEGALASVVGGLVECPVIAVPTSVGYGAHFNGLAPLLGMLNSCSTGVVVVNIDNGFGAGYAAAIINKKIAEGKIDKNK